MVRPLSAVFVLLFPVLVLSQNVYPNTRIVMVPAEYVQQYQQQLAAEQAKGRQAIGPVQFTTGQGQQQPRYISVPPIPAAPTPVYDTQYQHVVAQAPPLFPPTQRVAQLLLPSNADRQVQKVAEQVGGQDLGQQIQIVQQQSLANQALTAVQRRNMAEMRRAQQQNVAFQAQVKAAQQNHKQQYLLFDVAPNHSGIPPPPPVPRPPQYRAPQPQPTQPKVQYEYTSTPSSVSGNYQAQLRAAQQAQPQRYVYDVSSREDGAQSQHEAAQQEQYLVEVRPQQAQTSSQQPRYQLQHAAQHEYEHSRPQYVAQQYESEEVKQPSPRVNYRPQHSQSQEQEQEQDNSEEEHDTKSSYQFGFDVKDDHNTNYQNRKETRQNGKITGSYSVVDSDGYIRTVTYTADSKEGFKAEVVRKPTDIVVKIPEPKEKEQELPQEYYREVPVHLSQNVKQNVIYRYQ